MTIPFFSHHTIIFDLVTLTLKFDILFKNFNLGHNLRTVRDRAFIFHVYFLWQDLTHHTIIFHLVTLTLKFDLLFKNFNLGHKQWTVRGRAFIFHMCIPYDKTFHTMPLFWPSDLDLELWITYTKCCYLNLIAFRRTLLSSDNSSYKACHEDIYSMQLLWYIYNGIIFSSLNLAKFFQFNSW